MVTNVCVTSKIILTVNHAHLIDNLINPTMPLSHIPQYSILEHNLHSSVPKWGNVGYGADTVWDLWNWSIFKPWSRLGIEDNATPCQIFITFNLHWRRTVKWPSKHYCSLGQKCFDRYSQFVIWHVISIEFIAHAIHLPICIYGDNILRSSNIH